MSGKTHQAFKTKTLTPWTFPKCKYNNNSNPVQRLEGNLIALDLPQKGRRVIYGEAEDRPRAARGAGAGEPGEGAERDRLPRKEEPSGTGSRPGAPRGRFRPDPRTSPWVSWDLSAPVT